MAGELLDLLERNVRKLYGGDVSVFLCGQWLHNQMPLPNSVNYTLQVGTSFCTRNYSFGRSPFIMAGSKHGWKFLKQKNHLANGLLIQEDSSKGVWGNTAPVYTNYSVEVVLHVLGTWVTEFFHLCHNFIISMLLIIIFFCIFHNVV